MIEAACCGELAACHSGHRWWLAMQRGTLPLPLPQQLLHKRTPHILYTC